MAEIGDVYRGIVKGRLLDSVETRNMFTYKLTSANCTDDEVALAIQQKMNELYSNLLGYLSEGFETTSCEAQKWTPASGGQPGYWTTLSEIAQAAAGLTASDISSFQTAALIVCRTLTKKVLGRKFIPGIPESLTADGEVTGSLLTALGYFLTGMLDFIVMGVGGAAVPGVLDKSGIFRPFISGVVGSVLSTMRRRKPGYGM